VVITPQFVPNYGDERAGGLAVQADGKILLAGVAYGSNSSLMAVARYTAAGQLDASFGSNGTVALAPSGSSQASASAILVQSNAAIVLGGFCYNGTIHELTLARLQSNGQLDTSFGSSGYVFNSSLSQASGIAQGVNGDILVPTYANGQPKNGVSAYHPTGALDTSFGAGGMTTDNFRAGAIAVQGDGKIITMGLATIGGALVLSLARYLPSNSQIGWPAASPNPVAAGTNVTLTVSNISDNAYPATTVTQVTFYQDTNGNGVLDSGDTLLGTGTLNTSTGVWSFTLSTTGLHGTYTLFAQAYDGSVFYDPISIQVTVN
jgi:uncharacterized delta-60 repeat protein